MKTILMTAYALNPNNSSENETAWNIASEVAKQYKVILITQINDVLSVQKNKDQLEARHAKNIECFGFDLSKRMLMIRDNFGVGGQILYHYLWQIFVIRFIKQRQYRFDVAHCLNANDDRLPHFLWLLGKPTFWGPVGHNPLIPLNYIKQNGSRKYLKDRFYAFVNWSRRNLDPCYRLAVLKTTKIIGVNSTIGRIIGANHRKMMVVPIVSSPSVVTSIVPASGFNILSIGRLCYKDGLDIAIRSFARFYKSLLLFDQANVTLTIVGNGEELVRLHKIAIEEKIQCRIKWVESADHITVDRIYRGSNILLCPSHEGSVNAVPEALSYGIPVVCFNNQGPGELTGKAGVRIEYGSYEDTIINFSDALFTLFSQPAKMRELSALAKLRHRSNFTFEREVAKILLGYVEIAQTIPPVKRNIEVVNSASEMYSMD